MPALTLDHLSYSWPDGSVALDDVTGAFGTGRTGLVGRNGSGKSTLLRLAAGELVPTAGRISVDGSPPAPGDERLAYLPQRLTLDVSMGVAGLLGVDGPLDAVRAIANGDVDPARFDEVADWGHAGARIDPSRSGGWRDGGGWDVEARAHAALAEAGLAPATLDARVGELSGGEAMLAALTGIRLRRADVTLLDEPTNNLDRDARHRVHDMIRAWRGALIVVSHDLDLLELMDDTVELRGHALSAFGGPYSQWRAHVDAEQVAARQAAVDAKKALQREKRQRIEAETKIARRAKAGRKAAESMPKILANALRKSAEETAGRQRVEAREKEDEARAALDAAGHRIRDDDAVVFDLPDPSVAAGRRILTLGDGEREWIVQGPERVALVGLNGSGKTTLLRGLLDDGLPRSGPLQHNAVDPGDSDAHGPDSPDLPPNRLRRVDGDVVHEDTNAADPAEDRRRPASGELHTDRVAYLPQRIDGLDESASAIDEVRRAAPGVPDRELRNRLARFLLRGDAVHRPIGSLSGGERFRVAIARLLLADPPPQLLVLDEPTNNLDIDTAEQLLEALRAYRGAVLIVSHDDAFLRRLEPNLVLGLENGRLTQHDAVDPGAERHDPAGSGRSGAD
ncbi:ATP-binding cassette domain-containing protein [Microbacterium karelineae]|uniref:ATP-binding cassette domain-containing protein n=1 Tax=Microbacterium karelineae TaxID=2654283 RepID=UPI0012E9C0CE|nr:ATP-binding cassette domain-containing protein [Microbacterium karelineae]